jgi:hypothetical protein
LTANIQLLARTIIPKDFVITFTNTKTNFEYAADEITDLQGNVILKTALTGTTLNNNMGNALISNVQLRGQTSTVVPGIGNVTNATATINFGAGSYQIATTQGNTQLAFTGWPSGAANLYGAVRLQLTTTAANATHHSSGQHRR